MRKLRYVLFIMLIGCILWLIGCSEKNSIVGTWLEDGDSNFSMAFYEDGTCHNTPVRTHTSADAISYKIQEDGRLFFDMEWDGPETFELAVSKEQALEDGDYYFISKDTLILCRREYVRE